jgi:hypothetical protein
MFVGLLLLLLCACSDIDYVEFQRQGGGVISSSVRTFDLLIKQRSNNTVSRPACFQLLAAT